jgi:hypothetical protein
LNAPPVETVVTLQDMDREPTLAHALAKGTQCVQTDEEEPIVFSKILGQPSCEDFRPADMHAMEDLTNRLGLDHVLAIWANGFDQRDFRCEAHRLIPQWIKCNGISFPGNPAD